MATTINKQRLVTQVLSAADSLGVESSGSEETRPVLEEFIHALCREGSTPEHAAAAFDNLKTKFFDWNEVRVSSVREREEVMGGLSDTERRAQRVLSFLQEVFETTFSFDLDPLVKKGQKQAAKSLLRYLAANDFAVAWVVQRSLGGHAVPLDAPTLRVAKRLGLLEESADESEATRATLEHFVPKAKNMAFSDAMSEIAERVCWEENPQCGDCPLRAECPTGQANVAEMSLTRAKPR